MIRGVIVVLGMLVLGAESASAQIIDSRLGRSEPIAWTSLGVGWLQQQGLCDPDSSACWEFGSAAQFRASLEMPMGRGASFGIVGTTARVPLTYSGGSVNACGSCDADANVSQIFGNVHIGGGSGFHQVIDLNAGMTLFSNFRSTAGSKLGPGKMVSAFSFAVGYGFGYALSERLQIMMLQDYGMVIHKRLPGDPSNTAQQTSTRVGLRYGLGSKGRGF